MTNRMKWNEEHAIALFSQYMHGSNLCDSIESFRQLVALREAPSKAIYRILLFKHGGSFAKSSAIMKEYKKQFLRAQPEAT